MMNWLLKVLPLVLAFEAVWLAGRLLFPAIERWKIGAAILLLIVGKELLKLYDAEQRAK